MLRKFLNKIISKLLHENKKLPDECSNKYIFSYCFKRLKMFVRGFFTFGFSCKGKNLFRGKRVAIECKKNIKLGNCVTIYDEVEINANSTEGVIIGDNVSIGKRTIIKVSGSLFAVGKSFRIGNKSSLGNDCFVGAAGGVEIGNNVAIGQNVRFHSENHEFRNKNLLISEQGVTNKGIKIGNDCWIGAGAVFLDGVNVGNGCVIGANTLVNKSIPDYAIAVGNPVKIIGYRE